MLRLGKGALLLLLLCLQVALAGDKHTKTPPKPQALSEHDRALHALQRLTFGPRPGDLEKVLAVGVDQWIDQQLNPGQISNSTLDGKLAQFRTLRMQPRDLAQAFPTGQMIREAAEGKRAMPSDPTQFGVWEVLVERYKEQQKSNAGATAAAEDAAAQKSAEDSKKDVAAHLADMLLSLPKANRMTALIKLPVSDRLILSQYISGDARGKLVADFSPAEREAFTAMNGSGGIIVSELQQAKILRAVYGERQLEEVMTDFWFNHFNVFINKDQDQYFVTSYERDLIRPNALGKFRNLLEAVAKSPAMLYYLDNWLSMGPNSQAAGVRPGQPPKATTSATRGLNENYGRELMELHTLGVDGGYTQADVTQVARVFTGWTIQPMDQGWGFVFDPKRHEPGPKTVLNRTISEDGVNEGLHVLDILASSPATARFISTKLARRFVADDPPPELVKRMAQTFIKTDGDIKEVLHTMITSSEFWAPAVYRKKVKTPLEFVVSAVRATATQIQNPQPLVQALNKMGMPLYQMQPPTGYSAKGETWMNSDALLERLNFSMSITSGNMGGVNFDPLRVLALGVLVRGPKEEIVNTNGGVDAAVMLVEDALIGGEISKNTDNTIRKSLNDPDVGNNLLSDPAKPLAMIIGLTLGSPEFQMR